jgi:hypothetical protein
MANNAPSKRQSIERAIGNDSDKTGQPEIETQVS